MSEEQSFLEGGNTHPTPKMISVKNLLNSQDDPSKTLALADYNHPKNSLNMSIMILVSLILTIAGIVMYSKVGLERIPNTVYQPFSKDPELVHFQWLQSPIVYFAGILLFSFAATAFLILCIFLIMGVISNKRNDIQAIKARWIRRIAVALLLCILCGFVNIAIHQSKENNALSYQQWYQGRYGIEDLGVENHIRDSYVDLVGRKLIEAHYVTEDSFILYDAETGKELPTITEKPQ